MLRLLNKYLCWWWEGLRAPFIGAQLVTAIEVENRTLLRLRWGEKYFVRVPEYQMITLQARVRDKVAMAATIEAKLPFKFNEVWAVHDSDNILLVPKDQIKHIIAWVHNQPSKFSGLCFNSEGCDLLLPINPTRLPIKSLFVAVICGIFLFVAMQQLISQQSERLADLSIVQRALLPSEVLLPELPIFRTAHDVSQPLAAIAQVLSKTDVIEQLIFAEDSVTMSLSGEELLSLKAKLESLSAVGRVNVIGNISSSKSSNRERARFQMQLAGSARASQ